MVHCSVLQHGAKHSLPGSSDLVPLATSIHTQQIKTRILTMQQSFMSAAAMTLDDLDHKLSPHLQLQSPVQPTVSLEYYDAHVQPKWMDLAADPSCSRPSKCARKKQMLWSVWKARSLLRSKLVTHWLHPKPAPIPNTCQHAVHVLAPSRLQLRAIVPGH